MHAHAYKYDFFLKRYINKMLDIKYYGGLKCFVRECVFFLSGNALKFIASY